MFSFYSFSGLSRVLQSFALATFPSVAEAQIIPENWSAATEETAEIEYVDLNAVILIDVSTSHSDEQLAMVLRGISDFLLSDESMLDYSVGAKKAITVVSFAGDTHTSKTYVIDSIEDAQSFIQNFIMREEGQVLNLSGSLLLPDSFRPLARPGSEILDYNLGDVEVEDAFPPGFTIRMSDGGEILETPDIDYTPVMPAMQQARYIFNNESYLGITTDRRIAIVVGDHLMEEPADTFAFSQGLTREFGVRVCSIVVDPLDDYMDRYGGLNTVNDEIFVNNDYEMTVSQCPLLYAETPENIALSVQRVLSFPRF